MGTNKTNLEKYLDLWNLFEYEIENSNKLEKKNLSSFAKYYEKHNDISEGYDYKKIYERLKKMKKRKDSLKTVRENTLLELENFYKSLRQDHFTQELLPDEDTDHWFN